MSEPLIAVQAPAGRYEGLAETGLSKFLGIRYAQAPVGERRFKAPEPIAPTSKTIDATQYGDRNFDIGQPERFTAMFDIPGAESEDCLFLNIYVPADTTGPKPVLVWIHGGAFIGGSGNQYDPSNLVRKNDVIVVTFNYRLGIFGFLNLQRMGAGYEGSANLGLQDQIAALKWVNDNIAAFGGDASNITLFGESAGAASVMALMGAPDAEDLFHKAMAFSGAETLSPPFDQIDAINEHLRATSDQNCLEKLLAMSAKDLSQMQQDLRLYFGPSLDGVVLTRPTCEAIQDGGASKVPILTGNTAEEGTLLAPAYVEFEHEAQATLFGLSASIGRDDGSRYAQFLNETAGSDLLAHMTRAWFDTFRASAVRVASAATKHGAGGWVYNFDVATDDPLGVTHAADIPFIFDWTDEEKTIFLVHEPTAANRKLAEQWSRTLVAFARTGSPNGKGLPDWPQYGADDFKCMHVAHGSEIVANPDGDMLKIYKVV